MFVRKICLAVTASVAIGLLAGCGGSAPSGPQRYSVSGTVTFNGEPIPKGFISFTPDSSKGAKGPGSGATIVDGAYQTEDGKGVVGGPHLVEIRGTDGVPYTESGETMPEGKELFRLYKTEFDFPNEDQTKDFEVPAAN